MGSDRTDVECNKLKNGKFVPVCNQNTYLVAGFCNCMICGENYYVQGIPYPALNSVRAEICISFGHAGLQILNECEEQTLLVQK